MARNDFAWGSADGEPRKWQLCTLEIYVEQGRGGRAGQRMMMLACEDSSVTTAPLSGCVVEAVGDGSGVAYRPAQCVPTHGDLKGLLQHYVAGSLVWRVDVEA